MSYPAGGDGRWAAAHHYTIMSGVTPRTLEHALNALGRFTNYERTRPAGPRDFNLDRPRRLLEALGCPHAGLAPRVIQIAGSKGKGSTTLLLDAIHRAAGLKTGRFTSPHLVTPLERITVDGEPIPEAAFAARVDEVLEAVDGETTFFEAILAAACLHFRDANLDAVLFEVGLGGRLDATSVVPTTRSVLTGVSLEHTEILGSTVEEIAADKSEIIRPGVPVFSGVDPQTRAGAIIRAKAGERGAPFTYVTPPPSRPAGVEGVIFHDTLLPLLGRHQVHNAAIAAAVSADLGGTAVSKGFENARLPARCEFFPNEPGVLLDGAHTRASVRATRDAVKDHFPHASVVVLFALAEDKDLDGIARLLAPLADQVVCTRADGRRGRTAQELALHPAWNGRARCVVHPADGLDQARKLAGPQGLVVVTGSMYLAGALRPLLV